MNQPTATQASPAIDMELLERAARHLAAGELKQAAELSEQLMRQDPTDCQAMHLAACVAMEQGRLQDANALFKLVVERAPDLAAQAAAWYGLGSTLREAGDYRQAEEAFRRATTLAPGIGMYWTEYGRMQAAQDRLEAAIESFRKAIQRDPGSPIAYGLLGNALNRLGRHADAMTFYKQALARKPDHAPTHFNMGTVYQTLGQLDDARSAYLRALELNPALDGYAQLGEVLTYTDRDDPRIGRMQAYFDNPETALNLRMDAGFALAKAYDDLGEYDLAFGILEAANKLKRATVDFSLDRMERNIEATIQLFSKQRLAELEGATQEQAAPIFIVGMPRSGSTLIEQILAAHSKVKAGGELPVLPMLYRELMNRWNARDAASPGTASELQADIAWLARRYTEMTAPLSTQGMYLTDKAPNNFRSIGIIHLAFPNARIIHTRRDPLDTCLSCYQRLFSSEVPYNYDLRELGGAHHLHDRLMAHWHAVLPGRILEVAYEEMVAAPEKNIRRILDFCNLEFEPACLEFHKVRRPVTTASSAQVRQPIYKSSVARWKNYEKHLAPLREALGIEPA